PETLPSPAGVAPNGPSAAPPPPPPSPGIQAAPDAMAPAPPPRPYPPPAPYYYPYAPYYYPYYFPPPPVTPRMQRQSTAAFVVGIVGIAGGNIAVLFGAVCALGNTCSGDPALGVFVGGLIGLAAGIPLLVYGNQKVPIPAGQVALPSHLPAWAGAPGGPGW